MKQCPLLLTTALLLCTGIASAQWTQKDFRKLKKLAGNWEAKREGGFTQENWQRQNDSTLTGVTYNIDRGVSILDERLQLVYANREIQYIARVSYQNKGLPVTFRLVSIKDDCYTFENKKHDFPQQIVYCLKSGKELDVTVSGPGKNGNRSLDFHFRKR